MPTLHDDLGYPLSLTEPPQRIVSLVPSLTEALRSLRRLFTEVLSVPAPGWISSAAIAWSGPPALPALRTIIPVWRDPWMVVGARTFTGDVIRRLGLAHIFGDSPDRYPRHELTSIVAAGAELAVLPDEPYRFTAGDGPEAFPGIAVALVSGRSLTWYGPSLTTARADLTACIQAVTANLGREQR